MTKKYYFIILFEIIKKVFVINKDTGGLKRLYIQIINSIN